MQGRAFMDGQEVASGPRGTATGRLRPRRDNNLVVVLLSSLFYIGLYDVSTAIIINVI